MNTDKERKYCVMSPDLAAQLRGLLNAEAPASADGEALILTSLVSVQLLPLCTGYSDCKGVCDAEALEEGLSGSSSASGGGSRFGPCARFGVVLEGGSGDSVVGSPGARRDGQRRVCGEGGDAA